MANPESTSRRNPLLLWWGSLTPMARLLTIALTAPLLVLNGWALSTIVGYFQSIMVTLLVAALFAFLLNYPVSWLERKGLKRFQAAIVVFLVTVLFMLVLGVTLVPLALAQAQQLVARLPEWLDSGQRQLVTLDDQLQSMGLPVSLDGLISQINDRLRGQLQSIAGKVLNVTLDVAVFTVARVVDVLLTIITTFYLLLHGDEVWGSLLSWLPIRIQDPFSRTLRLSFQNYFIGQIIVSSFMAFGLTSIFLLLKVPFGLLFGLTIGAMALIPFGGSVGIALVTFLVALRDIRLAVQVVAVAVLVQQIVENGIAPRILGSVTGLNPFWVFISILTGARVGGLLGVVVAVPTAVVIKQALESIRTVRQEQEALQNLPEDHELMEGHHPAAESEIVLRDASNLSVSEEISAGQSAER